MISFEKFRQSLNGHNPPEEIQDHLLALWYDAKGDWEKAHGIIQDIDDKHAAWIHAYLHRKEGDNGNADYWYRIAGSKRPRTSLQGEWVELVREFLD